MGRIRVPEGTLESSPEEDALRKRREEIKRRLLEGQPVKVDNTGAIRSPTAEDSDSIQVPPGKLAASFYWYEQDPELLGEEVNAMKKYFPGFTLYKAPDGSLFWVGQVTPGMMTVRRSYTLKAIYGHNHPSNDSFGGSIKVYSVDPSLEELARGHAIPHTLRDGEGSIYICTSRKEDFMASKSYSHSAASAIAWAVKWISAFELWLQGSITEAQFAGHQV